MKKFILILALVAVTGSVFAQKKTPTSATVAFDASTSIDALPKAENKTVIAALDPQTGSIAFEANVKNFAFSNPTIQEHFNGANWMNSDQFATFVFKGNLGNGVDFSKDGVYSTIADGTLTVKGVAQNVKAPVTITVKGGAINATSNFSIKLADYGISGAPIDGGKVAKEPKVSVSADFK